MLPNNDTVDKNLPDNAGDMGSIPGSGRFHKYKQLNLCTTTEPVLQNLGATTPDPTAPQHRTKDSTAKKLLKKKKKKLPQSDRVSHFLPQVSSSVTSVS